MHAAVMVPIFPAFWNQVTGRLQEAWGPAGVERMQGRNPSCRFRVRRGSCCCCCKGPHHARKGLIGERAGVGRPMTAGRLERLATPVFFRRGVSRSIGAGAASWAVVRKPHCVCVRVH